MKKLTSSKNYNYFLYLLFSLVILIIGYTPVGNIIKYPFSYVFDPVYLVGTSTGESVSNWGEALLNASSYIEEYNNMKEEILRLQIEISEKVLDYNEYQSLKQHTSLVQSESKYIEAQVIKFTTNGEILINKGRGNGIEVGDVVLLGKTFIGIVSNTNINSSLITLPLNNSSNFEVIIIPSNINISEEKKLDSYIKSNGVITGGLNGIKIENIGINSDVNDGDTVLIRDEKVSELLVLGTVVGISKNPASTYKNGFVSPVFDYNNLLTVFVKIE